MSWRLAILDRKCPHERMFWESIWSLPAHLELIGENCYNEKSARSMKPMHLMSCTKMLMSFPLNHQRLVSNNVA
jgi:hypothetical protein